MLRMLTSEYKIIYLYSMCDMHNLSAVHLGCALLVCLGLCVVKAYPPTCYTRLIHLVTAAGCLSKMLHAGNVTCRECYILHAV